MIRRFLPILTLLLSSASFTVAQQTAPVSITFISENDTTVGTTWDSTWIGPAGIEKMIQVSNDGSASIYVALGNDTTGLGNKNHHFWTIKSTERGAVLRAKLVSFVRTKASTGTVSRRIDIGQ